MMSLPDMVEQRCMALALKRGDEIIVHDEGEVFARIILEKVGTTTRVLVVYDKDAVDVDRGKVYARKFSSEDTQ